MNMENEQVYVDDPNVFEWQAREAWIKQRQKALADELRLKYLRDQRGIETSDQMVGGRYINSPLQIMNAGLSPGVRSERIAAIEKAIQQGEQEYSNADQRASIRHAQQRPGVVASGEDREGNPIVPPANPQDLITWAERGKHIPSRRELLEKLIQDQTIAEPLRAENRLSKVRDREDLQQSRLEERKLAEQLGRDRLTDAAFDAQYRRQETARHNQTMEELRRQMIADAYTKEQAKADKEEKAPKTTESERSSSGYLQRMRATEPKLEAMEAKGIGLPSLFTELGSKVVGKTMQPYIESPDQQQYRNLTEDWIRAKLRKESGAVIGEEEMAAEFRLYFPMSGDDAKTVKQKQVRRAAADVQLGISAGNAPGGITGGKTTPPSKGLPSGWTVESQ